jgi:Ser/Thr protein kinase RdoA (MazF antagonist)
VSPKNILIGPKGPVFLDAECAWYGDPAFDVAFCLNHLLLKCLVHPERRDSYLQAFEAFATAYLDAVRWEPRTDIEARTAALLPALLLARVDGKSPVEYLTQDEDKERVRKAARPLIDKSPAHLQRVVQAWRQAVSDRTSDR